MKKSQKQFVLDTLRKEGKISRNFCLQNYISRLGAIVCNLRKEGMNIEAEFKDNDYMYRLMDTPKVTEYFVGGVKVSQKTTW